VLPRRRHRNAWNSFPQIVSKSALCFFFFNFFLVLHAALRKCKFQFRNSHGTLSSGKSPSAKVYSCSTPPTTCLKGRINNGVQSLECNWLWFWGIHETCQYYLLLLIFALVFVAVVVVVVKLFWPANTRPVCVNIKARQQVMAVTTLHSVITVLWKEAAFSL